MSEGLIHPPVFGLADVPVFILAGGLGTRLSSVLPDRPKCLADVSGRPFLRYQLDALDDAGFRWVVLCTGYLAEQVQRAIGECHGGLQVAYSPEHQPLGTGGSVRLALDRYPCDFCMILNGDSWCDLDYSDLIAEYRQTQTPLMVLSEVEDTGRYGRVETDDSGAVIGFAEKGLSGSGWINAGVYVIPGNSLLRFPTETPMSLEKEIIPRWVEERRLRGHRSAGRFLDIGTPETLKMASCFFQEHWRLFQTVKGKPEGKG